VPSRSWTIAARAENVALVRQAVAEFMVDNGIAGDRLTDIRLAVSESVTNAIVHAFLAGATPGEGTVTVDVSAGEEQVEIVVRDDGSGMAPRDDSPGVGLGLPLIRQIVDGFDHREPPGGGTELWMCFSLRPER
jgi:serine/threonine-protein kinase RsbW/stage II sporulation protein AB (anti-sigma F factor)